MGAYRAMAGVRFAEPNRAGNHDRDGDGDGTTIAIAKP